MAARKNTHNTKKSVSKPRAGVRTRPEENMRWMPEVSSSGELFLRRREMDGEGASGPGSMNYPFSQGLTFVARRWRNLMNEELRAVGQSQARWGTLYWIAVFGDTVNQTELADRIGVEQPTLGRVLRDLEAEGLTLEAFAEAHDMFVDDSVAPGYYTPDLLMPDITFNQPDFCTLQPDGVMRTSDDSAGAYIDGVPLTGEYRVAANAVIYVLDGVRFTEFQG